MLKMGVGDYIVYSGTKQTRVILMSLGNTAVAEKTILVIDRNTGVADRLREIIEFMDTPSVLVAAPEDWTRQLGERRLEALFVGPDLSDGQLSGLMSELEDLDPNVPVVMLQDGAR